MSKFSNFLARFPLAVKLGGFGLLMVAALVVMAAFSWRSMDAIGSELVEIAEIDLPLANSVSHLTELQLEQAVLFERAVRFGEEAGQGSRPAFGHFNETRKEFVELAHEADVLIAETLKKIEVAKSHAASADILAEWQHVEESLSHIGSAHLAFEERAESAFDALEKKAKDNLAFATDAVSEELALINAVSADEDALNHELEALSSELAAFTLKAAKAAETHEKQALMWILTVGIVAVALAAAATLLLTAAIAAPMRRVIGALEQLGEGDTTVELEVVGRDEAAQLTRAYEIFRVRTIEADAAAEREKEAQAQQIRRAEIISQSTTKFDAEVAELLQSVAGACGELDSAAQTMSSISEETNSQASAVAAASEEASTSVATVAAAVEELSAAIGEIGGQASQSSGQTRNGRERAEIVNNQVRGLKEAATQIGEVITLIQDVAEQTNLLALNATIEAARAGDAGRGFAVVANEVKQLAGQSAKAAEEISSHIIRVQTETESAVVAVDEVAKIIEELEGIAVAISSAVEEQGAATQEIARSIQDVTASSQETSRNIEGVSQAAGDAGRSASSVVSASSQLSTQSDRLRQAVQTFLDEVRAA